MNFLLRNAVKVSRGFSVDSYASLSFGSDTWLSWDCFGNRRSESWRHGFSETVWFGRQAEWGARHWTAFFFSVDTIIG